MQSAYPESAAAEAKGRHPVHAVLPPKVVGRGAADGAKQAALAHADPRRCCRLGMSHSLLPALPWLPAAGARPYVDSGRKFGRGCGGRSQAAALL